MPEQPFQVLLTQGAEQDLEAIYNYIAEFDTKASTDYVLDALMQAVENLASFPERGSYPKELSGLGIQDYRQVFFKPYRLNYRVIDQTIYIVLIADARRDMQGLLGRRLLGA